MTIMSKNTCHWPVTFLKNHFGSWLVRHSAIRPDEPQEGRTFEDVTLGEGSVVGPEKGIGKNIAGGKERVIIGPHSYVRGRLLTYGHGGRISIGEWGYVGVRTEYWSMESITIGDRVLISHNVNIHDGTAHSLDARERHEHFRHILRKWSSPWP